MSIHAKKRIAEPKYRPCLSASQIVHIISLAKKEIAATFGDCTESINLVGVLAPFNAKVEAAAKVAAYTTSPTTAISSLTCEDLGAGGKELAVNALEPTSYELLSKEQQWEVAYKKYSTDPSSCSLTELAAAKEHMYLNDLMTPEQEREYEGSTTSSGEETSL